MVAQNEFNVPGPGTYTANYSQQVTSLTSKFGTEMRQSMASKGSQNQPAPNAYDRNAKNAVLHAAPSFGFGTSKRPATADSRLVPGPGTYQSKTIIGTDSQGKSLGSKLKQQKTTDMFSPGPGTYNAKAEVTMMSSPGWKVGTSTRNDADRAKLRCSNFPPPDTYNPEFTRTRQSMPSWGFGSSVRKGEITTAKFTPAPGTYAIKGKTGTEGPTY